MNKKILALGYTSCISLAILTSCSDSTSPSGAFYNPDSEINSSNSEFAEEIQSSNSELTQTPDIPEGAGISESPTSSTTASQPTPASSNSDTSSAPSSASNPANSVETSSSSSAIATNPGTEPAQANENTGGRPVITYAASGATATNAGNCITVTGGSVTIKCGGEYDFSGSYSGSDAQILVNTAKTDSSVYLNMKGLTLTNTADAPIYIQKTSKAFVVAKNGTTNTFTDASTRTKTYNYTNDSGEAKTDTTGACIYAKDDLTIKGEGTLIVKANYNNGIHTSNDLKVKNGLITVNAKNNGLKGKGSVEISGGTINITTAEGDGIKSDTEDAADLANGKGSIEITGGTITVTSAFDGITAANAVIVANGESTAPAIKITSGGGQSCLSLNTSTTGGRGGMGGFGGMGGSSCSTTESMKGIKGDSSITISGGVIDINSRDDGLHSSGTITLSGGTTTIATDDDGVHADKSLYVKDNANVSVTIAYEGMESPDMNFEGGITSVITTDDGWNAAGGTSTTSTGNTGRGGWGGAGGGMGGSTGNLKVSGGYHYVYVGTGDTDGIDSNGGISITGGVIIVECRMNGGMGGMVDSDGTTSITGGKLLGFGTNNSEEGTQYSVSFTTDNYYGTADIAFKPSFSGSRMVSNVGKPSVVNSISGMTKTCFGNSTDRCVYTN
ncbi:carbohydrate-binding domain-containing protein [Fibrobacter sp. UBA4297]|uniref:carbohydrate-binding domain-containing protein n=1 Tax=Fibrobacter sp. UBA4297 TaxID=1946536 RepID=UPI0025BE17CD|nr:carbohydrate-binding domain-containing protein [Fibrobacter sp. UBA4297]